MKRIQRVLPTLFTAAALTAVMVAPAVAADRKPIPIPQKPAEMTFSSQRGVIYCEVWLFTGTPETGIAGVYFNTSNLNNSANKNITCPGNLDLPPSRGRFRV